MFDVNTELLIKYLMFSFEDVLVILITWLSCRWTYNDHHWKRHLPDVMKVNLESRDKMIADKDIKLAKQDEEILELKKTIKGISGVASGEVKT